MKTPAVRKHAILLPLVTSALLGATWLAAAPEEPAKAEQGVAGTIVKLVGNFMPGPDGPKGTTMPQAVPVHVFKGKVKVFQEPDPEHPAFVGTTQADEEGAFRIPLPPGDYTVVPEIDGKLQLNIQTFDGKHACWATVKVEAGKWTTFNVRDTSQAAF